ncbi:MAG TPA: hypothetical protein PLM79_03160 [Syntrophobacteraceae bacterium]|nr:hypothetical protein [Syntrophobacteraceae bacterium]
MKSAFRLALAATLLLSFCALARADELEVRSKGGGAWDICYQGRDCVGTLQPYQDNGFNLYKSSGDFVGTIFKDGRMQPPGRWVMLTAEDATLYLEALKAIALIKDKKKGP